jgi:hypothetical protein
MTDHAMARWDNDEERAITASDPSHDLHSIARMVPPARSGKVKERIFPRRIFAIDDIKICLYV